MSRGLFFIMSFANDHAGRLLVKMKRVVFRSSCWQPCSFVCSGVSVGHTAGPEVWGTTGRHAPLLAGPQVWGTTGGQAPLLAGPEVWGTTGGHAPLS